MEKSDKAFSYTIEPLGDIESRVVQNAQDPATLWSDLNDRYNSQTTSRKNAVLSSLLTKQYKSGSNMGDHISEMESLVTQNTHSAVLGSNPQT